ncbi:hypothetical protein BKA23_2919 [Rudaeicoccus suwonensis]|uniref:Signal transduction histidine kinase n=1 Tax=Rudaeicoccus suwonensis TaxID=657409 RepID=A0A561E0T9_9MICO|nr:hypothetical protein BKA23_2919 [Rudaeicoccus suwonensis]
MGDDVRRGAWALAVDVGTRRIYAVASAVVAAAVVVVIFKLHVSAVSTAVMICQLGLLAAAAGLVLSKRDNTLTSVMLCAGTAALLVLASAQQPLPRAEVGAPLEPVLAMTVFTVFAMLTIRNTWFASVCSATLACSCLAALQLRGVAWQTGVLSVSAPLCASMAVRIGITQLRRAATLCDLERANRAIVTRREAELAVLARQTTWVSRFVHDEVLHSLRGLALGARIPRAEAVELAGSALRNLDASIDRPRDDASRLLAEVLMSSIADCGIDVTCTLDTIAIPAPVAEALGAATREALRNVRLHSGVGHAELTARRRAGEVTVVICDRGRGFDPTSTPAGHRGISDSLRGRMVDVGGDMTVASQPGKTTVTLVWREPNPPHARQGSRLEEILSHVRQATVAGGAPYVVLNVVQAVIMSSRMQSPQPALIATAITTAGFVVAAPLLWRGRHVRQTAWVLGVVAIAGACLAALSVTSDITDPMAYWLAGGVVPLVVIGVVLRPAWESVPFAVAVCAVPLVRVVTQGGGADRILALSPALFGPEYVLGAAYGLRWLVGRSIHQARVESDRAAEADLHAYELRARERLLVERVANLRDDVAPFLRDVVIGRLALGSSEVETRAALLEGIVRDSINPARVAVNPHIDAVLASLRRVGVIVKVHANGTPSEAVTEVTAQVLQTLNRVGIGGRVTVQLHADGGARVTLPSYEPTVWSSWQQICPHAFRYTDRASFQTVLIPSGAAHLSPTFGTRGQPPRGQSQDHGDADLLSIG